MKKTLLTTLATVGFAAGAFAQGQILFQANAGNGLVSYSTDNATSALYPTAGVAGYGTAHVSIYTAPSGTVLSLGSTGLPDFTGWNANTLVLNIATGSGKTSQQAFNAPNAANNVNVEVEVVGWNGTATSWAQAIANAGATSLVGWSGRVIPGGVLATLGQLGFVTATGDPNGTPTPGTPQPITTGSGGYAGLILAPIPEPSTIALGGLGAAALLLFRRRK